MTAIRTPDDEVTTPGTFYPPFREGWTYQGQTYPGHSDYSVDWNRRTPSGGWLQDEGDPVLAAAAGTVAEVDKADGLVMLNHYDGMYRTESRHMKDIVVKVGDKVERGDRLGSIGNVAGSGASFGAHLHHVHWKRPAKGKPFQRIQMRFEGKPVATSVAGSDAKPKSWTPPAPVYVVGPPPRATWESAYREAAKALTKAENQRDDANTKAANAVEEAKEARRQRDAGALALSEAITARDLAQANAIRAEGRIKELEEAQVVLLANLADTEALLYVCTQGAPDIKALEAERDGALARAQQEQERANVEADRATELEGRMARIRELAA